jgi:hypothetical protein
VKGIVVKEMNGTGYLIPVKTKAEAERVKNSVSKKPDVKKVIVRRLGKRIYRDYGVTLDKKWGVWVYSRRGYRG